MIQIEDNDSPIRAAQKIIDGIKTVPMTPARSMGVLIATGKAPRPDEEAEVDMFSDSEIREIADYLLVYCDHHIAEEG